MRKNQKHVYVIANKENGRLLIEDCKLPFYWLKSVAKRSLRNSYCIVRISYNDIEKLILSGKIN